MIGKKKKKHYGILLSCLLISAIGFGAVYGVEENRQKKAKAESQAAQERISSQVSGIIEPKKTTQSQVTAKNPSKSQVSPAQTEELPKSQELPQSQVTEPQEEVQKPIETIEQTKIGKPVSTDVIMDYCMDKTVYFATLDSYRYNPAMIFSAKVNDEVMIVAKGTIKDIYENEETGTTVVEDLGGGYEAVYGQLKDVTMKVGDEVVGGHVIGFVKEPTKYYVKEGANVFLQIKKDGKPVDPKDYFR